MFDRGPDGGIDLRYMGTDGNLKPSIIGQCKHYRADAFSNLLSNLKRKELPKVERLAPQRYIVMTSVRMTPDRKNKILAALHPWIRSPGDIMGVQDINGLLAKHTKVTERHIKLWLTSTEVLKAVLDRVLNNDINIRSQDAFDRIKSQLRLWVPNPSLYRSLEILETDHVCVISGSPGVGKTMLADILMTRYIARGFQQVVISEDISEGDRAWRAEVPQFFVFDDFLGQVTYGQLRLRKSEPSSLANFFERVRKSDNKRFVLTTREYILSEASQRYDRLSDAELADSKCTVSLEDYTRRIRARILYNHLFWSEIPRHLKSAFLPNKRYWKVINHKNYNPRVIDHAVNLRSAKTLSADEFYSRMLDTLDNPTEVWERIFENLPTMARRVLLAVASLPSDVLLKDVEDVVKSLSPRDFDHSELRNSIKMIEGTFIDLSRLASRPNDRTRKATIRDPSVLDYLWARLEDVGGEAEELLERAVFFEQCVVLYQGRNHVASIRPGTSPRNRSRDVIDDEALVRRAVDLVKSPVPGLQRLWNRSAVVGQTRPMIPERRTAFLLEVLAEHPTNQVFATATTELLTATIESWGDGRGSLGESLQLLKQSMEIEGFLEHGTLEKAQRCLLRLIENRDRDKEVFQAVVRFSKLEPVLLPKREFDPDFWRSEFDEFLDGERYWLLEESDDADLLEQEIWELGRIAEALGTDIASLEAETDERIKQLQSGWTPDDDDDWRDFYDEDDDGSEVAEIDSLFQLLR